MLSDLKACKEKRDLADLLGFKLKTITYQINVAPDSDKYNEICISKKNGKSRTIFSPNPILKSIQKSLLEVLSACYDQIHGGMRYPVNFGFIPDVSIYENAKCHTNRRWVFNVDIENYFDSINFGRVWSYLQKNKNFQLNKEVATMIAQIVCFKNRLPQGAPTSPMMANLVSGSLDYRLRSLASVYRCTYSRYADDITFSTNLANFPAEIAKCDAVSGVWQPGEALASCIESAWFALNDSKTRMSYRRNRQTVTGLVVNKKVNVDREYFKKVRSNIHYLLSGRQVEINEFCDPYGDNCEENCDKDKDKMKIIEGRINFCFEINNKNDSRNDGAKFFKPSSIRKTYRDFLVYKYFVNGNRPIIITEGESDIIYLAAYLKARKSSLSELLTVSASGDRETLIDFYRFPLRPSKILGMTGGTSGVAFSLRWLGELLPRLGKNVSRRKVLVLLDNDDGLKPIAEMCKSVFSKDLTVNSNEDYVEIDKFIRIVKTPHIGNKKKTCIEDFLPDEAKSDSVSGKTYSPKADFDATKHFGKIALSHRVYDQRDALDFTKFDKIASRMSEALS